MDDGGAPVDVPGLEPRGGQLIREVVDHDQDLVELLEPSSFVVRVIFFCVAQGPLVPTCRSRPALAPC